jgi:hypothetical protein
MSVDPSYMSASSYARLPEPTALTVGESTIPRLFAYGNVTLTTTTMRVAYFTAQKTETITQVRVNTSGTAAGATPTLVRFGVYTVAADGALTLIASTPNDTTLLAGANTAYTKALSVGFTKQAGVRYAVAGLVATGATAPTLPASGVTAPAAEIGIDPRLSAAVSGQADRPASVAAGSITNMTAIPYMVLLP